MTTTIDNAFVTQFESEVKLAYQRQGSKTRSTVRVKDAKGASTVRFPKLGKGAAGQKSRNGNVPVMNLAHSYVEAIMEDWYAADYVDKLDELKTNIDERQAYARSGGYALGRKIDDLVFSAARASLPAAQKIADTYSGTITKDYAKAVFKKLNDNDVPDDGDRVVFVPPAGWNDLLGIQEFADADYVGQGNHPWLTGTQAKRWLNMMWVPHTGLPSSGSSLICLAWHRSAIGLGENAAIKTSIDWVAEKAAFLVDSMMSAGAIRVDDQGVVEFYCEDN